MKVRIQKNSIRFRLKQPEVSEFAQEGFVTETLEFGLAGSDQLAFRLSISNEKILGISHSSNLTTIHVPAALADEWTGTNRIGFDGIIDTGKGRTISVLVEKDFVCMDGREEENIGSYPNPLINNLSPGL